MFCVLKNIFIIGVQLQRYEGASTLFGPYTLPIYLKQYSKLAKALVQNTKLDRGPEPDDIKSEVLSFLPPVVYDTAEGRHKYGDCIKQPPYTVTRGQTVEAKFVSSSNYVQNNNYLY